MFLEDTPVYIPISTIDSKITNFVNKKIHKKSK
jgi:hypothetical protein